MNPPLQLTADAQPLKHLRLPRCVPNASENLTLLSWQPRKANVVWLKDEWTSLCEHLHNENSANHFVMGFRDDKTAAKRYVRSKRVSVSRAISWSWGTIVGTSKSELAFVPYSTNERQESRWGGLDFDGHDGNSDRPRELAFAAFRWLVNVSGLSVILETSGGGGWHVWAISADFHPIRDWVRLMKSIASHIGVPVACGICEIFPPDSLPSKFGKGMRAPGCWNPGSDTVSEIYWENTRNSLGSVLSGKSKTEPLICNGLGRHFPDTKKEVFFSSLYRVAELLQRFGIREPSKRNDNLCSLTGEMFNQVGFAVALRIVELQFQDKTISTNATLADHISSFKELWRGLEQLWQGKLSETERKKYQQLDTENERDAFRIIYSFRRKARLDGEPDFPVARDNLGERIGITGKGAAGIRDKLVRLGVITKTANYVANKAAARFAWLL